jgi:hypothetical protein
MDVNLERSEARHNTAKACHDELEKSLSAPAEGFQPLRTFFDKPRVEVAQADQEDGDAQQIADEEVPK